MNRVLIALTTALLCGNLAAYAQQRPNNENLPPDTKVPPAAEQTAPASAPAPSANASNKLSPGSVIPVQLTKSVDAKKVKTGDEVVAKVTQDLKNNSGTVLVTKDTKVVGHVTEAQARSKEQKESQLAIAFDRMVPKTGEAMQMPMSIQAIIAPPNSNSASTSGGQQNAQPASGPPPETGGANPGGRQGSMGSQTASAPQPSSEPSTQSGTTGPQQPITANTKGVVGIANLNLSASPDATQGSVVTSEKNNAKLDDGTFLLLRVNQ